MALDSVSNLNVSIITTGDVIFGQSAEQRDQVGGVSPGDDDYQILVRWGFPTDLNTGKFILRVKSGDNGTDGKNEIAFDGGGENLGLWPKTDDVAAYEGSGEASLGSAQDLILSTEYIGLIWWVNDLWYERIWTLGTHTIADLVTADGSSGTLCWPAGNGIVRTNSVTISGTTTPATNIDFFGGVTTGAAAGTVIGTAVSDRSNGTWSIGTPSLAWASINASTGIISVATGQTAPAAGTYSIQLRYDNSAITGGDIYVETITITVNAVTANTLRYIQPVVANTPNTSLTISQLQTELSNLTNSWNTTMSNYGLATSGVEPVLQLAATDFDTDLILSNYGPFPERVHIRGQGTYSRNAWRPTLNGTNVNRLRVTNCEDLSIWLLYAAHPNGHEVINCDDVHLMRMCTHNDVAESVAAASLTPTVSQPAINFDGSTNIQARQITIMGTRNNCFGRNTINNTDNVLLEGIVFDQMGSDGVSWSDTGNNTNWTLKDWICFPRFRNPGNGHRDASQFGRNVFNSTGWLYDGVFVGVAGWWGNKNNISFKIQQVSGTVVGKLNHTFFDCFCNTAFFAIDGAGGKHSGGGATYCASWPSPAYDEQEERGETGNGAYRANGGFQAGIGTVDHNIAVKFTTFEIDISTGPNGEGIVNAGFVGLRQPQYDWSEYANWFENYNMPANPLANKEQISPNHRDSRIGHWKPKVGCRAHWGHANPVGPYRLMERLFSTTNHDNPHDWGWPTGPLFWITSDSRQECGGAWDNLTFDANGDRV